jgi:hypothetical protein
MYYYMKRPLPNDPFSLLPSHCLIRLYMGHAVLCLQVGLDTLRVESRDDGKVTAQRHFSMTFSTIEADGEELFSERYGAIQKVYLVKIGGKDYTLIDADWYKVESSYVDLDTETPRLRLDLVMDNTRERIVEANDFARTGRQVVVSRLDYDPTRAVVLDRRFDTLLIPEDA